MIVSYKPKWSEDNELLKSGDCNNTSFHSLNSSIKDLKDVSYDIKVISNEELTKISSMLRDTLNWCNCISKQIEALNKLKTATKSKSTKSDKPDKPVIKKKTILL